MNIMADVRDADHAGIVPRQALLDAALRALKHTAGVDGKIVAWEPRLPAGKRADARITFDGPLPPYLVEIRGDMTPARIGPVAAQLAALPPPRLLATQYVTPSMAERLREADIQFIDTAGNTFLYQEEPPCHIFVTGKKPRKPTPVQRPIRAFRAAGLRVIFVLLCDPAAGAAPFRELATKAGVALGTVAQTITELKQLGFLRDTRKGRVVQQHRRCIDNWVDAYVRELRPRLNPCRFRIDDPDWWKDTDFEPLDMWLGGEAAGALLTGHLRPEMTTVYGTDQFAALARRIGAIKDEHGNLEVLDAFWHFKPLPPVAEYRLAPALLVYADLVATGDARNRETAEMIRERFLEI